MNTITRRLKRMLYAMALPPVRIYWFLFRPHTYGAKVVIERDGQVLLVKHSYGQHTWCFPGGGKKRNESLEGTAIREAREEVGLTLSSIEHIGEFITQDEYKHDHVSVFVAEVSEAEVRIDEDEIIDFSWCAHQEEKDWTPNSLRIWRMYMAYKKTHNEG